MSPDERRRLVEAPLPRVCLIASLCRGAGARIFVPHVHALSADEAADAVWWANWKLRDGPRHPRLAEHERAARYRAAHRQELRAKNAASARRQRQQLEMIKAGLTHVHSPDIV